MSRPEYIPHDYQERTIERVIRQPHLGQLLDPGLGKTSITLEAFRQLRNAVDVNKLLVVAPLRVCYSVWPREIAKWKQFAELRCHLLHGSGKDVRALRAQVADVYVINPEGLPWLVENKDAFPFADSMLAIDESTKFKKTTSERSKNLRRLGLGQIGRRNILTGTPAPNGLVDLHGQMFIVDQGASLGAEITHYLEEYFVYVPCGSNQRMKWKPRPSTPERIKELIAPWVVRLDARDYLEMPEKIIVDVEVDLPPKARELYKELKAEMVLQLSEGSIVAFNAGVLTGKCRQIANGGCYYSDDGVVTVDGRTARRSAQIHTAKADALASIVEELQGQPLLVAFEHRHELQAIRTALKPLGVDVPSIDGSTSAKEGARLEASWNLKELPVLCVHPLSAAHGLNLQEGGHHLAWYSIPWDLELYDQLVGRVWRQGQTERTFVYHIVARDTIDRTITRALGNKAEVQQDLLDALRTDLGA